VWCPIAYRIGVARASGSVELLSNEITKAMLDLKTEASCGGNH